MDRPPEDRDPLASEHARDPAMSEATAKRIAMVEDQLRARGVSNPAVLGAMGRVRRERFVPADLRHLAYEDEALGIESGQTISQPFIVARMTELLEPHEGMHVLEVGTGSGYQAAVLAEVGCRVISIERYPELADAARRRLSELGYGDRVRIEIGDGTLGFAPEAPYEGILVTAGAPRVPPSLLGQLADGGRLVIPVGPRDRQDLLTLRRRGADVERHNDGPCVFVPLVGAEGHPEEDAAPPLRWL